MANRTTVLVPSEDERRKTHVQKVRELRQKIRDARLLRMKQQHPAPQVLESKADIEDPFADHNLYASHKLLIPPYNFRKLYSCYEESSILPKCISAMKDNIPGFGYDFIYQPPGDPPSDSEREAAIAPIVELLEQANESQSFLSVRRDVRQDLEVTGNGYYEVVRNRKGDVVLIYRVKAAYMRMTPLDETPIEVTVPIRRMGKIMKMKIKKRFRRFAYLTESSNKAVWFKEFGDPRPVSASTGEIGGNIKKNDLATEVIHIGIDSGTSPYGIPRWIGQILNVLGVRAADFVNYDLFVNQGIPPLVVMVSGGGVLTEESINELEDLFSGFKGYENFNKIAILEAEDLGGDVDSASRAKIELKPLIEYRKDDQMFRTYIERANEFVRHAFRLPPIFIGVSESYTFASAKTSRLIAEEQIFKPERLMEDEILSWTLFRDFPDWKIRTKGPEIIRSDELATLFQHLVNSGALSMNNAIQMANKQFDLKLKTLDVPWADYPLPIVLSLAKVGLLALPEDIMTTAGPSLAANLAGSYEPAPRATSPEEKAKGDQEFRDAVILLDHLGQHIQEKR